MISDGVARLVVGAEPLLLVGQTGRPLFEWSWVVDNTDRIVAAGIQHVTLTMLALGAGLALSIVLAWWSLGSPRRYRLVIESTSLLFTLPSLALFALLAPLLGLGVANATVALTSYTLLILVRNIVTGIEQVDSDVIEAATAVGLSPSQVRWKVQVPLALPAVIAGLRIAAVTVIGLVTVTALLGLGGLGQFILSGFRVLPPYPTMIFVGTALSVVLAIVFDVILLAAQRAVVRWRTA